MSLLEKMAAGTITPAEQEALVAYMRTVEGPAYTTLMDQYEQIVLRAEVPGKADPELFTAIRATIAAQEVSHRVRMRWTTYAAAAAVLFLLLGGYWYFRQTSQSPMVAGNSLKTDLQPGSNRALLTLADGSVVTLDTARNQVIAQGNTAIHQSHGQLEYTAEEQNGKVSYNTLTTPRGGQFQVVLPDGTRVWLNSGSSLRYPTAFTGKERSVRLEGQAYFEVVPSAIQPFKVQVKEMDVWVLGTSFDVMAYADEKNCHTTLQDGAVKVVQGTQTATLQPGEQAVLQTINRQLSVHAVDVAQEIAWKSGYFEFDNEQLPTIMRQIARWYDVDISYGTINEKRRFGGRISRNLPLSRVLHILEVNGASFQLEGKLLHVTSK